ncbi:MAG: hypothetical protein AMXMBFR33_40190 [Candidatus Xenobia bacterium]
MSRSKLPPGLSDVRLLNTVLAGSFLLAAVCWTFIWFQIVPALMWVVAFSDSPLRLAVGAMLGYPKACLAAFMLLNVLLFLALRLYLRKLAFRSSWFLPVTHAFFSLVPLGAALFLLVERWRR